MFCVINFGGFFGNIDINLLVQFVVVKIQVIGYEKVNFIDVVEFVYIVDFFFYFFICLCFMLILMMMFMIF